MATQISKPAYAKFDPAHTFDGLFVPTNGKPRGVLNTTGRMFGDSRISFQGFSQLGADDQSVLLALVAKLGICGKDSDGNNQGGAINQGLRKSMFNCEGYSEKDDGVDLPSNLGDDGSMLLSSDFSLRGLLIDAGYNQNSSTERVRESLHRLRTTFVREINKKTRIDRVNTLISVNFDNDRYYVAANPRVSKAVFNGHHVKVSLFERNMLDSEIAKLLHCWLCSNVRLGEALGNGNGTYIDTLGPHVWGSAWEKSERYEKSRRRGKLKDALSEIKDRTCHLQNGNGWMIDQTSSGLVIVSRPQALPM